MVIQTAVSVYTVSELFVCFCQQIEIAIENCHKYSLFNGSFSFGSACMALKFKIMF